jgi:hypothetical protein
MRVASHTPISLLDVFADKTHIRPPLEDRISLASSLVNSISALFNSSWLHKSIRSENILFPQVADLNSDLKPATFNGESLFLTGFEYSRQNTEHSLGKPWNKDINHAMYRHPFYQGQAPGPYRIQYDIYSIGLVLVEIARWMPLSSFLDVKTTSNANSHPPRLSSTMKDFSQADAEELQKRVLYFVDKEMAFRVGTPYCNAVRWCLTHADEKMKIEMQQVLSNTGLVASAEVDWRPALDFYNNIVVPLGRQ